MTASPVSTATKGGTRVNAGVLYTFLAPMAVSCASQLGESFHVAGENSFRQGPASKATIPIS